MSVCAMIQRRRRQPLNSSVRAQNGHTQHMKLLELEVFSEESNHAIVRAPGRQFPGVVVQGDSLSILCTEAREISERLKALSVDDEELLFLAQDHQEKLLHRLLHYQEVLAANGIQLPFARMATRNDLVMLVPDQDAP